MIYKVTDGEKSEFQKDAESVIGHELTFECDPDDDDTAYDALAESLSVNDDDLIDFENAEDGDVKTLLDSMQKMGFIGGYEMDSEYGKAEYKGQLYYLAQNPYLDGYNGSINNPPHYEALAQDSDGNDYVLSWDISHKDPSGDAQGEVDDWNHPNDVGKS